MENIDRNPSSQPRNIECEIPAFIRDEVEEISRVLIAVAAGDLSRKMAFEIDGRPLSGAFLPIATTLNSMVDRLNSFAREVTRVAREVGTDGILGGQARVTDISGIWRDLTDNVNRLAGNLTSQVRAIADVSTAVTKGDLTRSIDVEARGEVLHLKDNLNQMIANLRETTQKTRDQDWLKSNLARFSALMQNHRSIEALAQAVISELTPLVDAQHGGFFVLDEPGWDESEPALRLVAGYGFCRPSETRRQFRIQEGLIGQCAFEKRRIWLTDVPMGFINIQTGLGEMPATQVLLLPVTFEGETRAVIELATFKRFTPTHLAFLDQLMETIGVMLNAIAANVRTEALLQELKRSNAELEEQAGQLKEKAEQVQLISRYKSEFLANMSHELRTPLNSLLILSKLLAENKTGNLTPEQVQFASTVFSSGNDLLGLINEILDLSKIEAGKMTLDLQDSPLALLAEHLERTFRHISDQKGLGFSITIARDLPATIFTDLRRLRQIMKNLLSNAFKFTERGGVTVGIRRAAGAADAIEFSVTDTGIGIQKEKQQLIFEAFQQEDGTTSRKYGGTGLGLTISREIARLLGGQIKVASSPGEGSTFTLCLPLNAEAPQASAHTAAEPPSQLSPSPPPPPRPAESGDTRLPPEVDFTGRKVLIVDDDLRTLFSLNSVLEARGFEVYHAEDGRAGIELLHARPDVDLVLMDTMMPGMDGLSATREIRKDERFRSLPILSLTAQAMAGDRDRALASGADDYIPKPFDPDHLLFVIHHWLTTTSDRGRTRSAIASTSSLAWET